MPDADRYNKNGGNGPMPDQLSVTLVDADLLAEVELTTDLIIAASGTEAALTVGEVDHLLGLPETVIRRGSVPQQSVAGLGH